MMNNEVLEIRNNIKKYFSDLEFDEPTHRYTLRGQPLSSVSHFIGKYKQKFDAEKIAPFSAAKRGISVEEILKEWEDNKNRACELGTKVHLFGEDYINNGFIGEPTDGYEEAIKKFWSYKPDHIVPLIMELQMYSDSFKIAGTADIICYNLKTKKLKIMDYKTNGDLLKVYKEQKMLPPFDNYLANALNGYKLQLSMYQILLEQTGYEVEDRTIIWVKPDGTFECYKTEDLTKTLLEELSKNKK